jgi:conjugative transfer signal peptidase TraF
MATFKNIVGFSAVVGLAFLSVKPLINPVPLVIWNATDSVPKGWYLVSKHQPKTGDIALIKLTEWVELYAAERGYLPRDVWLLKPVFATGTSVVCRFGSHVFVNGKHVAKAKILDKKHRPLPVWKGCKSLTHSQYFVIGHHRDSFDSRYFGAVDRDHVAGTAYSLLGLFK